jgi:hypothetical protein
VVRDPIAPEAAGQFGQACSGKIGGFHPHPRSYQGARGNDFFRAIDGEPTVVVEPAGGQFDRFRPVCRNRRPKPTLMLTAINEAVDRRHSRRYAS